MKPLEERIFESALKDDISEIYAHKLDGCDTFSCFDNAYPVGQEREFIKKLDQENPGKYEWYSILWWNSN